MPDESVFSTDMTAETVIEVRHPDGVLLDDEGNPVLDADNQPIFKETQS